MPVRDVSNELNYGNKTEPHVEIGAENFLNPCYQSNIEEFVNSKRKYLFLVTTCRNREMNKVFGENKTNQFIVGYIVKDEIFEIEQSDKRWYCIKGRTFVCSFEDAVPVKEIFGKNFAKSENKGKTLSLSKDVFIDNQKTNEILAHFRNKTNILEECVKEIVKLDQRNRNDEKTCIVLGGLECPFKEECLRWRV